MFSQSHIKVFGSLADVGSLTIGALELVNYSLPVVRFTLRTLLELSLSSEPKKFFQVYKVHVYGKTQAFLQYLSLLLSVGLGTGVSGKGLVPD